jgi:uncharacterized protein
MTRLASSTIDVLNNAAASRFEAIVDGHLCVANYHLVDGVMRIHHTAVPRAVAGRGIAAKLVQAAIEFAAANHLEVEPWCSYVRSYMKRHPASQALLPDGFRL